MFPEPLKLFEDFLAPFGKVNLKISTQKQTGRLTREKLEKRSASEGRKHLWRVNPAG